ncbi:MAG: DUF302 domain-containing protein [Actinomycetota bacterium]|nr:DUF302 domain-containing protein [Actinomycetota bacterium]
MRTRRSPYSVDLTVERLVLALDRHGVPLLAQIDHGAGAARAGLQLGDEQVLIFGDAKVGTLLIQADPRVGYELPLRLLVWDAESETMIGYRSPIELADSYALAAQREVLTRMEALLETLVSESVARG